jgi:hypothetical protein
MFLPNAEQAHVPPEKISAYLLNASNPRSRGKPAFFLSFGFSADQPEILTAALSKHAQTHPILSSRPSYGGSTSYSITGPLVTPDGRNPVICSVWQLGGIETFPRLITAYGA